MRRPPACKRGTRPVIVLDKPEQSEVLRFEERKRPGARTPGLFCDADALPVYRIAPRTRGSGVERYVFLMASSERATCALIGSAVSAAILVVSALTSLA